MEFLVEFYGLYIFSVLFRIYKSFNTFGRNVSKKLAHFITSAYIRIKKRNLPAYFTVHRVGLEPTTTVFVWMSIRKFRCSEWVQNKHVNKL